VIKCFLFCGGCSLHARISIQQNILGAMNILWKWSILVVAGKFSSFFFLNAGRERVKRFWCCLCWLFSTEDLLWTCFLSEIWTCLWSVIMKNPCVTESLMLEAYVFDHIYFFLHIISYSDAFVYCKAINYFFFPEPCLTQILSIVFGSTYWGDWVLFSAISKQDTVCMNSLQNKLLFE